MSADLSHLAHVPVYLIVERRGARDELLSDDVLGPVGMFNEEKAILSARITELANSVPGADLDTLELRHSPDGSQVFAIVTVPQRPVSRTIKRVEHDDVGRIAAITEETYAR